MKETIAFVGLGNMGAPMARNLAARGFTVRAYDQRMEAREALAAATDATAVASVAEAADGASVLVTMLPDNDHVKSVVIDEGAEALPARSLVIDMSSISPGVARDVHAGLADRGIAFVDAPVSGGTVGAQGGTLTIMAGGEADAFARAKPVLEGMGTTIVHAGGPGMGQVFKLCNQIIVVGNLTAIAEALTLCRAGGGDMERLLEALGGGAAGSWMLQNLAPRMVAGEDDVGFPIDLQLKDLRLVGEAAHAMGVPLPSTSLITALYLSARAHGEGGNGNQAIRKVYDRLADQAPDAKTG